MRIGEALSAVVKCNIGVPEPHEATEILAFAIQLRRDIGILAHTWSYM